MRQCASISTALIAAPTHPPHPHPCAVVPDAPVQLHVQSSSIHNVPTQPTPNPVQWYQTHQYASISTALIFVLAALTDWLDGFLARKVRAGGAGVGGAGGGRGGTFLARILVDTGVEQSIRASLGQGQVDGRVSRGSLGCRCGAEGWQGLPLGDAV